MIVEIYELLAGDPYYIWYRRYSDVVGIEINYGGEMVVFLSGCSTPVKLHPKTNGMTITLNGESREFRASESRAWQQDAMQFIHKMTIAKKETLCSR